MSGFVGGFGTFVALLVGAGAVGACITECTGQGWKYCTHEYEVVEELDATCMESGYRTYTCNKCDHSYTEEIEPYGHSYNGSVSTAPTCLETGEMLYTCTVCGDEYTEEIAAKGHSDVLTYNFDSYTGDMSIMYVCSACRNSWIYDDMCMFVIDKDETYSTFKVMEHTTENFTVNLSQLDTSYAYKLSCCYYIDERTTMTFHTFILEYQSSSQSWQISD